MAGKRTIWWRLTCAAVLAGAWAEAAQAEVVTVAVIPDTQNYTWSTRPHGAAMFNREIQFIVDHASKQNTVFAVHVGDAWEHGDLYPSEAQVAGDAMQILAGSGIPF